MVQKVALGGLWSQPGSWQDGVVPTSGPSLQVTIAPGAQSLADVGLHGADQPFMAGAVTFAPDQGTPSTLYVDNATMFDSAFLQVGVLYGGPPGNQNAVVVGKTGPVFPPTTTAQQTAELEVTRNAIDTHFIVSGGSGYHNTGNGEIVIDRRFDSSIFTLDGQGGQETLIFERPPLGFIYNEIDVTAFPSPGPLGPGSGPERIELGGVHFDGFAFLPYSPAGAAGSGETGALILTDHNRPVYALLDVQAAGYGGAINGGFSVGTDPETNLNYVQYSRLA